MFPLYDQLDVKVCRKHMQRFGMSNIFGFIAYTDSNPYIKKVLRDDDFWQCFNELSENWIIYAVKPPQTGNYEYPAPSSPRMLGMVIAIWQEPAANKEFIKSFGLQDTSKLPCFIAFGINEKDGFDQLIYPLRANSEEEAYASIRKIIEIISQTEKLILPENKCSSNVFREVSKQVQAARFQENISSIAKLLKELINTIKTAGII